MSIGKSIRRSLILATVLVAFCIAGGSVYAADQVKVHMINVGNADSFLVEYNGHYALIDGGRATNAGKYKNGKDIDGDCALDKYSTLEKALAGNCLPAVRPNFTGTETCSVSTSTLTMT